MIKYRLIDWLDHFRFRALVLSSVSSRRIQMPSGNTGETLGMFHSNAGETFEKRGWAHYYGLSRAHRYHLELEKLSSQQEPRFPVYQRRSDFSLTTTTTNNNNAAQSKQSPQSWTVHSPVKWRIPKDVTPRHWHITDGDQPVNMRIL